MYTLEQTELSGLTLALIYMNDQEIYPHLTFQGAEFSVSKSSLSTQQNFVIMSVKFEYSPK